MQNLGRFFSQLPLPPTGAFRFFWSIEPPSLEVLYLHGGSGMTRVLRMKLRNV
jgi:hypothetical protein